MTARWVLGAAILLTTFNIGVDTAVSKECAVVKQGDSSTLDTFMQVLPIGSPLLVLIQGAERRASRLQLR